jgi:hypothetical protein
MTKHQPIDPAAILQEAFPNNLLETMARECGFIERQRDFCPVTFFWALITSVLSHSCTGIAAVKREYDRLAKEESDRASFYKHFNEGAVEFMRGLFAHACETVFPKKAMPECLRVFTETLLQDSTILKLRSAMATRWPGAGIPSAVKLNVAICANGGGANKVQIAKGTKSEVKFTTINSSVKGSLLIFDMGYQSLKNFARIERQGGYFLTRLKESFHPTIAHSNVTCRGNAVTLDGKKVWEVVTLLKREILDVTIAVPVKLKGQPGPVPQGGHQTEIYQWRVIGLRNEETGLYHLYLTNIPVDWLGAEEIGLAYTYRWEVERLFAEFKGPYDLGSWAVTKDESMLCHVYAVLLAWAVSRRLRTAVMNFSERTPILEEQLSAPLGRWANALINHIRDVMLAVISNRRTPSQIVPLLRAAARDPNRGRIPLAARTHRVARNSRVTRSEA